ncbi:MAG TPA: urease subunit gamma [Acidimicrobiales bacterium]|nr:urease subunit gamma [Acidimicrobiales bacterium]
MRLTPGERDRLLVFVAAELARSRRSRGLRLNVPEATALIADTAAEAARDGLRLAEAVEQGRSVLGPDDVLDGVVDIVSEIRIEANFDDGTRLIVVHDPFRLLEGIRTHETSPDAPGAIREAPIEYERSYDEEVDVVNESDVAISVTSHYHFFEANPRLRFDRGAAYGRHLAIDAGSSVRFDPGVTVRVQLADIRGSRVAIGFAGLVDGALDAPGAREAALDKAHRCGYLDTAQ